MLEMNVQNQGRQTTWSASRPSPAVNGKRFGERVVAWLGAAGPRRVAAGFAVALLCGVSLAAQAAQEHYHDAKYFDRFNPPPSTFNVKSSQVGYDSQKRTDENALQFKGGAAVESTPIYDNQGQQLTKKGKPVVTKAGRVGYYKGEHLGKIHAGAVAQVEIDGTRQNCVYLAAVDIKGGGTHSGWVPVDQMRPADKVWKIDGEIYERRESPRVRYTRNPKGDDGYERMTVIDRDVPKALDKGYIIPKRTSQSGKATYYYIRDGVLNGFINLPETGKGRHGVQAAREAVGGHFWRDKDVRVYPQTIYGYDSKKVVGSFDFVFGYFETNAGTKIYCWTNADCLASE